MNVEILKLPPYLTIKDMKIYFAIERKKALDLILSRKIIAFKPGHCYKILSKSVVDYLEAFKV